MKCFDFGITNLHKFTLIAPELFSSSILGKNTFDFEPIFISELGYLVGESIDFYLNCD